MTASTNLVHIVSTTQPTGLNLGDEWYNPTTNTLYKNLLVNGTTTLVNQLPASANTTSNISMPTGTGTAAVQGLSTNIASGNVALSTSGTSIDFTGIPSWAKRITLMFNGVSTNGSSVVQVRLGTSSGIESTGYLGASSTIQSTVTSGANSTGLNIMNGNAAFITFYGQMIITLIGQNTYISQHVVGSSDTTVTTYLGGGSKALAGALTQLRITTANGTDAFDAGSIGILYE